uniref:Sodium-dependent acetylcholine transporter (inferred by orthology to a C. elegans protein) n=1 Tax=Strongyloides venezuelensis TaxID=75913 RepID=A0A0K0G1N0_STRVS
MVDGRIFPPFIDKDDSEYIPEGDIEYPFEDISGSGDENKIRGNWSSKAEYLVSVTGYIFGIGNLYRFPYLVSKYGGVSFIVIYFIMFFLAALPVVFIELSMGQFISLGALSIWKVVPLFKGIGISMLFISFFFGIYYNVIASWSIYYFVNSLKFQLPWATCVNGWNSKSCSVWNRDFLVTCTEMNGTVLLNGTCSNSLVDINTYGNQSSTTESNLWTTSQTMPALEYFHNQVLMISDGIDDIGIINWQLAICLLISWLFVFLFLFKDIKSAGKTAYIIVILPYVLLFVLIVRFLTLPGSLAGLKHFFKPDWSVFKNPMIWGQAAVQVFYSLSSCSGGLITLSSYNRFHNNVFKDVWVLGLIDHVTSLMTAALTFSAIGFMCYEMNININYFQWKTGLQLIFVFFAETLSRLPIAPFYAALFFLLVFLILLSSQIFVVETIVSSVCDQFPERLRKNHRHVLTFVAVLFYFCGLPLCSSCGLYWILLFEYYICQWPLIIIAFFEIMSLSWIYGIDNVLDNIRWMIRFYPPIYLVWKIVWKFLTPFVFLVILTFTWIEFKPMYYEEYRYPYWANLVGWGLSLMPILFIVLNGMVQFCTVKGNFTKRWRDVLCPENDWGPALAIHRSEYYPLQIPEARGLLIQKGERIRSESPSSNWVNEKQSSFNNISNGLGNGVKKSPSPYIQSPENTYHDRETAI